MSSLLKKVANVFRVSSLQQITVFGIGAPTAFLGGYQSVEAYARGQIIYGSWLTFLTLSTVASCLVNEALAFGKIREYHKVRRHLEEFGWGEEVVELKSHSWCQRRMVQVASTDSGFEKKTRDYLHKKGYRWYTLP